MALLGGEWLPANTTMASGGCDHPTLVTERGSHWSLGGSVTTPPPPPPNRVTEKGLHWSPGGGATASIGHWRSSASGNGFR